MGLSVWGSFRTADLEAELNLETVTFQGQLSREADERKAEIDAIRTSFEESLARRGAFLERQLELYFEAAAIASKIATSSEGADEESAKRRFRELYWGELAVVEDAGVQNAMVEFGRILSKSDKSACLGEEQIAQRATEPTEAVVKVCLLRGALDLAHAARKSLEESWKVGLLDLPALRQPSAE